MLWIALAVGSVLGVAVYVAIQGFRWSTAWLARLQEQRELERRRAVTPGSSEHTQRHAAQRVVDDIKQHMGALRTDVVWSITNSALWDMTVPASRHFFTALTVWDDQHATWQTDELVQASAEVKVLWGAAVDTATRLGIDHLPTTDRPRANTALKLVRKAGSTTSDAERQQLMAKAAEVLSGIISITIPKETLLEIQQRAQRRELTDPSDGGHSRSDPG